ncbi:MAG: Tryptophan synthase alpha chain [Labilithrix sp.]|nr:Tryptophan synthase alpha chain [Labilithrix sp.]
MQKFGAGKSSVAKAAGWLVPAAIVIAALVASCGTERPGARGDGETGYTPYCDTPNAGCACSTPGQIIECGKVKDVSSDYVSCSMGYRQCAGGHWSECTGETAVLTTPRTFGNGTGGIHKLGLGSAFSCAPPSTGPGKCVGGTDAGDACLSPADCGGGGICSPIFGECENGAQDGELCLVPADCPGGNCKGIKLTCEDGTRDGKHCALPADCPGGTCTPGWGACKGGGKKGKHCKDQKKCPGGSCYLNNVFNSCDPYCHAFVDTPVGLTLDGGLVVGADGGLSINPSADGGGVVGGGGLSTTAAGVTNCGGASNIVGPACTPPGLTTCQQDFHCDAITSKCLWNGASGYFDSTAGGADLTVGSPCGPNGSATATAPVCNRGSVAVPAGASITFHVTTGPMPPDGCTNLGAPTISFTLSSALAPGACTTFLIGNSPGNKFVTVNAGAPGATAEAAGRCANNSAGYKTDGAPDCAACSVCDTRITGKVFDPSGVANNVPLSGVQVFQPAGSLKVLTDGVQCDTCGSLASPAITETVTDTSGSFSLGNVSPGAAVPIVVQSGRWRRMITLNVPACATTAIPDGTLRMPKNRTDGLNSVADIPKMALVIGSGESLECWLKKVGLDTTTEVLPRTAAGQAHRIHLWKGSNGMSTSPAATSVTTLLTPAVLAEYSAVIASCDSGSGFGGFWSGSTAAQRLAIKDYTTAGGRFFTDHYPGEYVIKAGAAPFPSTATWTATSVPAVPSQGKVLATAPLNVAFRDWLSNVGASSDYGAGWLRVDVPRRDALVPDPTTTIEWIRGQQSNNWAGQPAGDFTFSYSFETPVGAAAGSTCGRVIYNAMHVADPRVAGGSPISTAKNFPADCVLGFPLTPEEKALEYQFFQLTACQLGGASVPPPVVPPPLPVVTYQRDYQAVCNPGERVKWGPLYWQSVVPPTTSIEFRAATAGTVAALPPSPPAVAPTTALVGTASSTVVAPAWDCNGCPGSSVTVDSQLAAQTATQSKEFLRVFMTFNPTGSVAPTLLSWRQVYDCVPAE